MMTEAEYTEHVRKQLDAIGLSKETWVQQRDGVYDVVIIGGGQSGMGAAFGLMRERVGNVLIIDENDEGKEGPWLTYARMITLRTPKTILSIDLGLPCMTFQSWWSAIHGDESWDAIDKIPRPDWYAYLKWFRAVLELPVRNGVKLERVEPLGDSTYRLHTVSGDEKATLLTRKVVLATGIQGGGEWHTPKFISSALPKSRYAHTSEVVDFDALKGKRIGILGGGASAFDNAQHALNQGVGSVDVFMRRKDIPSVNPIRYMEQTGVVPRYADLPDPVKYEIMSSFVERAQPPTNDTFRRSAAWSNFALQLGAPWDRVTDTPDGVEIETPKGRFTFDYLILSTGLVTDHELRPELSDLSDKIARWADIYTAPDSLQKPMLDAHPYLGEGFAFTPLKPEYKPLVQGVFAFNYSALMSYGLSAAALTGLGFAIPRLAKEIANQLFQEDTKSWMENYYAYDELEFVSQWDPTPVNQTGAA